MKIRKFVSPLSIKAGLLALISLSGCLATTLPYMRAETAQRLAAPAWMVKRDIPAAPFALRAYERIHARGDVAHLYIEGDGNASQSNGALIENPTPENPLALHLASKDKAENIIYLARPCQYTDFLSNSGDDEESCTKKYWGASTKYSDVVLQAYHTALNEIIARYDIKGFHLIGHDGGSVIAAMLATTRPDILSLRSVAANFEKFPDLGMHAAKLSKIPQYHFIGGQDTTTPPATLHAYLQKLPPSTCVQTMMVQEAGHYDGWVNKWPALLTLPVRCDSRVAPIPAQINLPSPAPTIMLEKPLKP